MGLPDEGFGFSKKRLRLGLSSKRKGNISETCLVEDQSSTVIGSSNDMSSDTRHASISDEGRKGLHCKDIGSSRPKDPLIAPVASLYNIGNTCYLNCMLQTLRYTPGFVENLSELKKRIQGEERRSKGKDLKGKTTQKTTTKKLIECLDDLFRHMKCKESDYTDLCPTDSDAMSIRPNALLNQIRKLNPLFEENSQHDAQELLRYLLGCLDDAEAELESEQAQWRPVKEEENNSHSLDNKDTSDFCAKVKKGLENAETPNGASTPNTSKLRGRKRKSSFKDQESNDDVNMMMNFVNKKKSKSTIPSEEECNVKDFKGISDGMNCDDTGKNVDVKLDSKVNDLKVGTKPELNSSGDAQYIEFSKASNQGISKEERKRSRLGMRRTKKQVEGDLIIISDDDEDKVMEGKNNVDNCAELSTGGNRITPLPQELGEVEKNMRRLVPMQNDKQCNSDSEVILLSTEQNGNRYNISPGKHLTIHSPLREDGLSLASNILHSRSFLSKIQGFLPNSARKFLNFSPNQPTDTVLAQLDIPSTQVISHSYYGPHDMLQSRAASEGDNAVKSTSQCLYEAKLKLKRCDWLGVSPVKSISANLVLERTRHESGSQSTKKKRITPDENLEQGDVLNKSNGKSDCEPDQSENKQTESLIQDCQHKDHIIKNSSTKSCKLSTEYRGCKIKPLSIQLTKLDWLGTNCVGQSFNIQDILKKSNNGTNVTKSRYEINQEEMNKMYIAGSRSCQGKPKCNEAGQKLVQGLFGGVMGHRTCCCECENSTNRAETFLDVSIPVRILSSHDSSSDDEEGNTRNTNSCVFKLLKSLSTRERLCKDNKYFCDQCLTLVEAERFCFFQDLPQVLAIHLKRFDAGLGSLAGYVSKISDHVSVPEHLPCLKAACKYSNCGHRYTLYAVVTHSGSSILCGHYRSYVKVTSSFNKQMYHYMNDVQTESFHESQLPSSHSFAQSSLPPVNESISIGTNALSAASLIGDTVEDIANNSFVYSKQPQSILDKKCGSNDRLLSMSSQGCGDIEFNGKDVDDNGSGKSWWLECDDESIRVFEEDDFLDRLSEDSSVSLLGTPYILFYHQSYTNGSDI